MKKLKKNQLKLDKEVISSLSENELSVVKGGVNTEPMSRCEDGKTHCLVPAPTVVECKETQNFCPLPNTQLCKTAGYTCPILYTEQVNCNLTNKIYECLF